MQLTRKDRGNIEINQWTLSSIEQDYESYMARKFIENFPYLFDEDNVENPSRAKCDDLLDKNYPNEFYKFHKMLREHSCWNCKRQLPSDKLITCEWCFSNDVHLCEHCYTELLMKELFKTVYESLLEQLDPNYKSDYDMVLENININKDAKQNWTN